MNNEVLQWLIQFIWLFVVLTFWDMWRRRQLKKKLAFELARGRQEDKEILAARAEFEENYNYALEGDEGAVEVLILDRPKPNDGGHLKIWCWGIPKASVQFPEVM